MASGDAGNAMGLDQAMIVAGIGCKAGASAREIEAAIGAALLKAGLENSALGLIATSGGQGGRAWHCSRCDRPRIENFCRCTG